MREVVVEQEAALASPHQLSPLDYDIRNSHLASSADLERKRWLTHSHQADFQIAGLPEELKQKEAEIRVELLPARKRQLMYVSLTQQAAQEEGRTAAESEQPADGQRSVGVPPASAAEAVPGGGEGVEQGGRGEGGRGEGGGGGGQAAAAAVHRHARRLLPTHR